MSVSDSLRDELDVRRQLGTRADCAGCPRAGECASRANRSAKLLLEKLGLDAYGVTNVGRVVSYEMADEGGGTEEYTAYRDRLIEIDVLYDACHDGGSVGYEGDEQTFYCGADNVPEEVQIKS